MAWGSSTDNESKPDWTWLLAAGRGNSAPKLANVVATPSGWGHRWPWGIETIVAIGGLAEALGTANVAALHVLAPGYVANLADQTIGVLVEFNEPVTVAGSPTLIAISNGPHANVTLTYNVAASNVETGRVVFLNNNYDANSAIGNSGNTFTINSTSTGANWNTITTTDNANAVANGIPSGFSINILTLPALAIHTATVRSEGANTAANAAGQTLSFDFTFNRPVTVANAAVVTVEAISNSAGFANATLTLTGDYSVPTSTLTFVATGVDLSNTTINALFTVNSTSVLTGFDTIVDTVFGGVPANTVSVANTVLVVAA